LEGVVDFKHSGITGTHLRPELFLKVTPNHEEDAREPRPPGIKHRIVEDRLSGRSHPIELFQSTVATAHARR
jgi:hypothetical protein